MARVDPQGYADKLITRGSAAVKDLVAGVKRVQTAPTAQAAAKLDKARLNYNDAIDSGRMAKRLMAVDLTSWQNITVEKAQQRYATGLSSARSKMVDFAGKFLPFVDSAKAELDKMSDVTIEDSIARASWWIRKMGQFQR